MPVPCKLDSKKYLIFAQLRTHKKAVKGKVLSKARSEGKKKSETRERLSRRFAKLIPDFEISAVYNTRKLNHTCASYLALTLQWTRVNTLQHTI